MMVALVCVVLVATTLSPAIAVNIEEIIQKNLVINPNNLNLYNGDKEFWAVVVVALQESLEPYIYNALLTAENWDQSHIKLLWKEEATKDAILASLDWLKDNADADDTVLFSVDSHGTYHNGKYGIWPWDGNFDNGFVTVDELDTKLAQINAECMCLIFECCFSGSFVKNNHNNRKNMVDTSFYEYQFRNNIIDGIEGENRVILMSASGKGLSAHWIDYNLITGEKTEISFSSLIGEAFTKQIDENNDNSCSVEEAFRYAKTKWLPIAIILAFNLIVQIPVKIFYGYFISPFPSICDDYPGELPIVYICE
jgi:hypothetical protein